MTFFDGNVSGPLTKNASYFLDVLRYDLQAQSIVNVVNPDDTSSVRRCPIRHHSPTFILGLIFRPAVTIP
jgi:hypothetical protein